MASQNGGGMIDQRDCSRIDQNYILVYLPIKTFKVFNIFLTNIVDNFDIFRNLKKCLYVGGFFNLLFTVAVRNQTLFADEATNNFINVIIFNYFVVILFIYKSSTYILSLYFLF